MFNLKVLLSQKESVRPNYPCQRAEFWRRLDILDVIPTTTTPPRPSKLPQAKASNCISRTSTSRLPSSLDIATMFTSSTTMGATSISIQLRMTWSSTESMSILSSTPTALDRDLVGGWSGVKSDFFSPDIRDKKVCNYKSLSTTSF